MILPVLATAFVAFVVAVATATVPLVDIIAVMLSAAAHPLVAVTFAYHNYILAYSRLFLCSTSVLL